MHVDELFRIANVELVGWVPWRKLPHNCAGVSGIYVIARANSEPVSMAGWEEPLRQRWIEKETIVYIGRASNIHRRLQQFYRHKLGAKSPHKGGEDLLRLTCPLKVYWGVTPAFKDAERQMIEAFKEHVEDRMPFGNRVRGARTSTA